MSWKSAEGRVISDKDYARLNNEHKRFFNPTTEDVSHEVGDEYNAATFLTIPIYPFNARKARLRENDDPGEVKAARERNVTGTYNDSSERSAQATTVGPNEPVAGNINPAVSGLPGGQAEPITPEQGEGAQVTSTHSSVTDETGKSPKGTKQKP